MVIYKVLGGIVTFYYKSNNYYDFLKSILENAKINIKISLGIK